MVRKNHERCQGITADGKKCNNRIECKCKINECTCEQSTIYCTCHVYFSNFTQDEIKSIKNNTCTFKTMQ